MEIAICSAPKSNCFACGAIQCDLGRKSAPEARKFYEFKEIYKGKWPAAGENFYMQNAVLQCKNHQNRAEGAKILDPDLVKIIPK